MNIKHFVIFFSAIIFFLGCIPEENKVPTYDPSLIKNISTEESEPDRFITYVDFTTELFAKVPLDEPVKEYEWDFGSGVVETITPSDNSLDLIETNRIFGTIGIHTVTLTITYTNDTTSEKVKTVDVLDNTNVERLVLMELFTGVRCPNCPPIDLKVDELYFDNGYDAKVVPIEYHRSSSGPDEWETAEGKDRHEDIAFTNQFSPFFIIDGTTAAASGNVADSIKTMIDARLPVSPASGLNLNTKYFTDERKLRIDAFVSDFSGASSSTQYLTIALLENNIPNITDTTTYQQGLHHLNFTFRNYIKLDEKIEFTQKDQTRSFSYLINLKDIEDVLLSNGVAENEMTDSNLIVAAFIQDAVSQQGPQQAYVEGYPDIINLRLSEVKQAAMNKVTVSK